MGLHRAFPDAEIFGVDLSNQPRYPFKFIKANVFELTWNWSMFDFIWASPPCQAYSASTHEWRQKGREYVDLITLSRNLLKELQVPYVIENVVGAPLLSPIMLCGAMFNLKVYRHRLFEASFQIKPPPHNPHKVKQAKVGRPPKNGEYCNPVGHFPNLTYHQEAMGISWMKKVELAQAVPPAYSEWIAREFIKQGSS